MSKKIFIFLIVFFFSPHFCVSSYAQTGFVTFTDVSANALVNQQSPTWGISWGDVNSDGWEDLYLSNHQYYEFAKYIQTPPTLFINQKDGTFRNSNSEYGLQYFGDQHGALWLDINNDGYPELFQTQGSNQGQASSPNFLYFNNGGLSFQEIAGTAGVNLPLARGRGGCSIDYNNDGFLDLYVCNAKLAGNPSTLFRNNGDKTFNDVGSVAAVTIQEARGCTSLDVNNDGLTDIFVVGNELHLFKNNGDGTFIDVSVTSFPKDSVNPNGYSWGDYDNDGDLDLYLAASKKGEGIDVRNQMVSFLSKLSHGSVKGLNFEMLNSKNVRFDLYDYVWRLSPKEIYIGQNKLNPLANPFILSVNDSDAVGNPGLIPGGATATYIWREGVTWYVRGTTTLTDPNEDLTGLINTDGQFNNVFPYYSVKPKSDIVAPSRLYENQGNGTFIDVAKSAGVSDGTGGEAAQWLDVDNDGDLDLYVVYADSMNNAPNRLYINNGNKTFTDMASFAGAEVNVKGRGENVAYGDYNNDGFLDLFVTNGLGPAPFSYGNHTLLRNNGNSNHWLKIRLIGTVSNRDAVGAIVVLKTGNNRQVRQQMNGASKYSQNSSIIHFGLSNLNSVEKVKIYWPSGVVQELFNVSADQTIELLEP